MTDWCCFPRWRFKLDLHSLHKKGHGKEKDRKVSGECFLLRFYDITPSKATCNKVTPRNYWILKRAVNRHFLVKGFFTLCVVIVLLGCPMQLRKRKGFRQELSGWTQRTLSQKLFSKLQGQPHNRNYTWQLPFLFPFSIPSAPDFVWFLSLLSIYHPFKFLSSEALPLVWCSSLKVRFCLRQKL